MQDTDMKDVRYEKLNLKGTHCKIEERKTKECLKIPFQIISRLSYMGICYFTRCYVIRTR